jgi:hypothetical protein
MAAGDGGLPSQYHYNCGRLPIPLRSLRRRRRRVIAVTVRVWAWREGTRQLVFSADTPDARHAGLSHVRKLREDPTVNRIEIREHMVTDDGDAELPSGIRGSLGWERTDGRWRMLPTSDAHLDHRRG